MILYLDTSAMVKLYVAERGSEAAREAVAAAERAATNILAYAEARSAFARRYRTNQLASLEFGRIKREFDADWVHFDQLPADSETVRLAGDFSERFGLRAYDAVHLASANLLQAAIGSPVAFACATGH
ncbi:MAG: type II toxin-antitoxin system VapC family toxin [Candidatus Binataceae bacterium]